MKITVGQQWKDSSMNKISIAKCLSRKIACYFLLVYSENSKQNIDYIQNRQALDDREILPVIFKIITVCYDRHISMAIILEFL